MDKKGLGIIAVLLFVSVFAFFFTAPVIDHNSSVQHNERVAATVLEADVDTRVNDGDREYRPAITYEYTVDGETYQEDNVYPGRFDRWHDSESTARDVADRYIEGSDRKASGEGVAAYYNPDEPGEAYLTNEGWPGFWFLSLIYVVVALAGGGYLIRKGFARWRQRQLIQNTPTEQAQSLSIGPSEITGRAVTADGEPFEAPFSDEKCVLACYEIKEYDTSGDNNSWKTVEEETLFKPFYVDDGTGEVLVRPHRETTFDLDPDDWSEEYVDSSERGPETVQEFVTRHDSLDFPSDAGGKSNDRKYRQNLIRESESVYVFGTVQPRDEDDVDIGSANADRLVIQKVLDNSMQEPLFLISDDEPSGLIERRKWALWRLPVGGFFLVAGVATFLFVVGPLLGIEIPRMFDGLISDIS